MGLFSFITGGAKGQARRRARREERRANRRKNKQERREFRKSKIKLRQDGKSTRVKLRQQAKLEKTVAKAEADKVAYAHGIDPHKGQKSVSDWVDTGLGVVGSIFGAKGGADSAPDDTGYQDNNEAPDDKGGFLGNLGKSFAGINPLVLIGIVAAAIFAFGGKGSRMKFAR